MLESFSKRAVELIETAKNLVQINNETNNEELVTTFYLLLSMYNANDTICHFLFKEDDIIMDDLIKAYYKSCHINEDLNQLINKSIELSSISSIKHKYRSVIISLLWFKASITKPILLPVTL